jgi:hypothetical protein
MDMATEKAYNTINNIIHIAIGELKMSKIAKNLTDLIGNTPLLELTNYNKANGSGASHCQNWNTSIRLKREGRIGFNMIRMPRKRIDQQRFRHYRAHSGNTGSPWPLWRRPRVTADPDLPEPSVLRGET